MRPALSIILAITLVLPAAIQAQTPASEPAIPPPEQQVWRGVPIRIDLRLNAERIVRLPGTNHLRSGLLGGPVPGLRVQALGDHIYLLAEQPFASTRMIVNSDDGRSILLDLAADSRFSAGGPLEILTGTPVSVSPGAAVEAAQPPPPPEPEKPLGYVALVRHAAQSLYAPSRLIPAAGSIQRAPLPIHEPVDLVRGGQIEATPVVSWRASGRRGPLWITAVKLRNTLARPVVLDPRDLRGSWRAASYQHARLGPVGTVTDTTTVYLVSDHRFAESLAPWVPAQAEETKP